ncbi:hypothetical protein KX816_06435 [Sphingosinicellaceae bacterium]|nr:hypothetical protein KX816_06435 [Sphingosinicellaceae bacterium]
MRLLAKTTACIVASLMFAAPALAVRVFGPANNSCGKWTADASNQTYRLMEVGWVSGFLTGASMVSSGTIASSADVEGALAWIDKRCVDRPLDSIAMVALELLAQLSKKPDQ